VRTSSDKRSIGKYRPESVRPDTGYGYGSGTGRGKKQFEDETPPWSERRRDVFDYVAKVLPDEHPGLAVSAALSLKLSGEKPTRETILNRLRASGRSADQLREKGWL
jgi:hypothetical protein